MENCKKVLLVFFLTLAYFIANAQSGKEDALLTEAKKEIAATALGVCRHCSYPGIGNSRLAHDNEIPAVEASRLIIAVTALFGSGAEAYAGILSGAVTIRTLYSWH